MLALAATRDGFLPTPDGGRRRFISATCAVIRAEPSGGDSRACDRSTLVEANRVRILPLLDLALGVGRKLPETPGLQVDAELLELLDSIRTSPRLCAYLADKHALASVGLVMLESAPTEELRLALDEAGISWGVLAARIRDVFAILEQTAALAELMLWPARAPGLERAA